MTNSRPTEQLVEDVAAVYFGAIGVAIKRGVEIKRLHHKPTHPIPRLDMLNSLSKFTQHDE